MRPAQDAARMVEDLGLALGVPWTDEERALAVGEGTALSSLLELIWAFNLTQPAGGWRGVEP